MRFISEDTYKGDVKDPLSLNLYTYCEGNPIKLVDIDGHRGIDVSTLNQLDGLSISGGAAIPLLLIDMFKQMYEMRKDDKSNELQKIELPDYRGKKFNKEDPSKKGPKWKPEKISDPQRWLKRLIETGYVIEEWTRGIDEDGLIQRIIYGPDGNPRFSMHMFQPAGNGKYFPLHYHIYDAFGELVKGVHYYWDKVHYFID